MAQAAQGETLAGRDPERAQLDHALLRPVERGHDHPVDLLGGQLLQRPDREPQEPAARGAIEHADRLEAELAQREIGQLGRLAHSAEREAPRPGRVQACHGLPEIATGTPQESQGIRHVLVGEPRLLRCALGGQHVAQPLARRGLGRELHHLDEALAREALEAEVGEPQGHAELRGQGPLGDRRPVADGGQDLEIPLVLALHGECSQVEHRGVRCVK